jgi:hypothetical protein
LYSLSNLLATIVLSSSSSTTSILPISAAGIGSMACLSVPQSSRVEWIDDRSFVVADFRTNNIIIYGISINSSDIPVIKKLYRYNNSHSSVRSRDSGGGGMFSSLNVIPPQYNYDAAEAILEWVTAALINDAHWTWMDLITIVISYLL